MSPAYSSNPDDIFCWVGIIMYMPLSQSPKQRDNIRQAFDAYCDALAPLMKKYNAQIHWAKIEVPEGESNVSRLLEMKERIHQKYPVKEYQELRRALDPEGVLANSIVEKLFNE